MEGDFDEVALQPRSFVISTHALTWRATADAGAFAYGTGHFYPRPHMEGDAVQVDKDGNVTDFYPRPHMEGDKQRRKSWTSR